MTDSGYPRIVKRWKRGTPLGEAEAIFEGRQKSVSVGASRDHYGDVTLDWLTHGTSFYTSERYLIDDGAPARIDIPETAKILTYFDGQVLIELKRDWAVGDTTHVQGTVVSIPLLLDREVDFVKLRRELANARPWTDELTEEILPR